MAGYRILRDRGRVQKTGQATERTAGDDGTYQSGQLATGRWDTSVAGLVIDTYTGLMWPAYPTKIKPGGSGLAVAHGNWANAHDYVVGEVVDYAAGTAYSAAPGDYAVGDVASINGGNFICIQAYNTGTETESSTMGVKCSPYSGTGTALNVWTLWWAPHVYICTVNHTSATADNAPGTGTTWDDVWDRYAWASTMPTATVPRPPMRPFTSAITQCEGLTYCGFSDWRLPNCAEFFSLMTWVVRAGGTYSQFDLTAFTVNSDGNVPYNQYWTSTSSPDAPTTAIQADLFTAQLINKSKHAGYAVMPVRGPVF